MPVNSLILSRASLPTKQPLIDREYRVLYVLSLCIRVWTFASLPRRHFLDLVGRMVSRTWFTVLFRSSSIRSLAYRYSSIRSLTFRSSSNRSFSFRSSSFVRLLFVLRRFVHFRFVFRFVNFRIVFLRFLRFSSPPNLFLRLRFYLPNSTRFYRDDFIVCDFISFICLTPLDFISLICLTPLDFV